MENEVLSAIIGVSGALVVCVITIFFDGKRRKRELGDANRISDEQLTKTILSENKRLENTLRSEVSQSNKAFSLQYVTDKRVDWIYTVREVMSEFISTSYLIADKYIIPANSSERVPAELLSDVNKNNAKLKLLFNFSGKRDKEILELINQIVQNISLRSDEFNAAEFQNDIDTLTKKCQIYLKLEWERVKWETLGNLSKDELNEKLEVLGCRFDQENQ